MLSYKVKPVERRDKIVVDLMFPGVKWSARDVAMLMTIGLLQRLSFQI